MNFINHLLDASEDLFAWNLSEQGFDIAAQNQACLLAGLNWEDLQESDFD